MLTDFISIYENALSTEYCKSWIEHIDNLREDGILTREEDKLHNRDHETLNFRNHEYDLPCGLPLKF